MRLVLQNSNSLLTRAEIRITFAGRSPFRRSCLSRGLTCTTLFLRNNSIDDGAYERIAAPGVVDNGNGNKVQCF